LINILEQIKSERRWLFKAQLIYLYHHAMQQEFGSTRGKKWTISDTAAALELSSGYISESLKLVSFYGDRDVSQQTRDEALKEIKKCSGNS
jgi:hypothetical protein